ncbi:O-antigen ligase family protein [Exiguobacterium artemiae]
MYLLEKQSKLNNKKNYLLLFLLLIPLIEPLYMTLETPSGSKNNMVSVYLTLILILMTYSEFKVNLTNKVLVLYGVVFSLFLHYFIWGGDVAELFRYVSLVILIYLISFIPKLYSLKLLFYGITLIGLYYSISQKNIGIERVTGFLNTSPTLFSYIMLLILVYLLFFNFSKKDIPIIFLVLYLIYLTESRSTLAIGALFIGISLFIKIKSIIKNKLIIFFIILCSIFLVTYIGKYINDNVTLRESGGDSTATRQKYIDSALNSIENDPIKFLIGGGAGQSYEIVSNLAGIKTPTHFDPLTVFVDYGIFGVIFLMCVPLLFFRGNWFWGGWILLFLGAIHNLLYFPLGLVMTCIIVKEIKLNEEQKNECKN